MSRNARRGSSGLRGEAGTVGLESEGALIDDAAEGATMWSSHVG